MDIAIGVQLSDALDHADAQFDDVFGLEAELYVLEEVSETRSEALDHYEQHVVILLVYFASVHKFWEARCTVICIQLLQNSYFSPIYIDIVHYFDYYRSGVVLWLELILRVFDLDCCVNMTECTRSDL